MRGRVGCGLAVLAALATGRLVAQSGDEFADALFAQYPEVVGRPCPSAPSFPRQVYLAPAGAQSERQAISRLPGTEYGLSLAFNNPLDSTDQALQAMDTVAATLIDIRCDPRTVELRYTLRYGALAEVLREEDVIRVLGDVPDRTESALQMRVAGRLEPAAMVYPCGNLGCPQRLEIATPYLRQAVRSRDSAAAARREEHARNARRQADALAARIDRLTAKGWPRQFVELIVAKQLTIGMSAEMVRESWGRPDHVNSTLTSAGTHEQWVYATRYVYLENDTVTAIQTTR